MATTLVPVDVYFDPKLGNWRWSIDATGVVGGGQATKEEAMRAAAEGLAFSLESDREPVSAVGGVIELLKVTVELAQ